MISAAIQWSEGAAGPVLRLIDDPALDWEDLALCAEVDPALFFPDKGSPTAAAKAVCRRCPVRPECLAFALQHGGHNDIASHGVWGGLSESERLRLRAAMAARAA